jgi:precorrin-6B methylase 2
MLGEQLQYELSRLVDSAWAVAAFVAWHRDDLADDQRAAAERVLVFSGLPTNMRDGEFAAALTSQLAQAAAFAAGVPGGWAAMPDHVLLAQGTASRQVADWIVDEVAPALGATESLSRPGTVFLDVGVGTGQLSARIAERLPLIRIVGLDRMEQPLSLARRVVAEAGCADRVDIIRADARFLAEESQYDLIWLPLSFISPDALADVLVAARRALRPDGWVIASTLTVAADLPIVAAMSDLFTTVCEGSSLSREELLPRMREAGYTRLVALPSTPLTGALTAAGR